MPLTDSIPEEETLSILSPFSVGVNSEKKRICTSRCKFFPVKVELVKVVKELYHRERCKQDFRQVNVTLLWDKGQGMFIRNGAFIRIKTVLPMMACCCPIMEMHHRNSSNERPQLVSMIT